MLPIGQHNKDITQFVDKVKNALGINAPLTPVESKADHHGKREGQTHSPRRLIKQVALESPPNQSNFENSMQFYKALKMDNQSIVRDNKKISFI